MKYTIIRAGCSAIPHFSVIRLRILSNNSRVLPQALQNVGHRTPRTTAGCSATGSYVQQRYLIRGATFAFVPSQSRSFSLLESDGSATRSIIAFGKLSPAVATRFAVATDGFMIPTAFKMNSFPPEP